MTDVLDTLVTFFTANWVPANTGGRTPSFNRRDKFKRFNTAFKDIVFFYRTSPIEETRNAFNYVSIQVNDFVTIEIWTSFSNAQAELIRDEAKRLMNTLRKDPTNNNGFEVIEPPRIHDRRDEFRKIFSWQLDYDLFNAHEVITT